MKHNSLMINQLKASSMLLSSWEPQNKVHMFPQADKDNAN